MFSTMYEPRSAPRVRVPRVQAKVAHRFLRFFRGPSSPAPAVLDLSVGGVKLVGPGHAPELGARLAIDLSHPAVARPPVEVDAVVRWARPRSPLPSYLAGLEFLGTTPAQRAQLEDLLSLELGSMVSITPSGHVGYAALGAAGTELAGTLFVYDLASQEVGSVKDEVHGLVAIRSRGRLSVERRGGDHLPPLIQWIFGFEGGKVTIDPPIDFAPGATVPWD